jgi:hypothetical protein
MRLLAANLTVAALVAHALLGCCWHHAHVAQAAASTDGCGTLKPVVHGDHVHSHEHEGDGSSDSGHHHDGPASCGETECTYAGGVPRVQIQSPLIGFDVPVIAPANLLVLSRLDGAFVARTASMGLPQAPIHLLYQVLVI